MTSDFRIEDQSVDGKLCLKLLLQISIHLNEMKSLVCHGLNGCHTLFTMHVFTDV